MNLSEIDVERAGLLHDIGKVYQRAGKIKKSHSAIGVSVLRPFFSNTGEAILNAVANHHHSDLMHYNGPKDDLAYIIYEADNLASASDRRQVPEGADTGDTFVPTTPLANVFNIFDRQGTGATAYGLQGIGQNDGFAYPRDKKSIQAPAERYQAIVRELDRSFQYRSPAEMTIPELLSLLESTLTYVPSSTNIEEVPDISLYDHQKLTAAFAGCMYRYFEAAGITDYKAYCYGNKNKAMRKQNMYFLVSGDISGIQKFIYTIPSKGALKSLRGRSLYLDILLEHIVDDMLAGCGVSRTCLIYTGGGHFYALLPNTVAVKHWLDEYRVHLNDWFLRHYGSKLYIALDYTACSAEEFMSSGWAGNVFQRVSRRLSRRKLQRYTGKQLDQLFWPDSPLNRVASSQRECSICHASAEAAALAPYGGDGDVEACPACNGLFRLGQKALTGNVFCVMSKDPGDGVPLPGKDGDVFLAAVKEEELSADAEIIRLYIKNELTLGKTVATHLWMGDYITKNDADHPVEFTELAKSSGGSKEAKSIERIGVLRADVDSLGAAFIAGLPQEYDTLSRKAAFSRYLSMFFKGYINQICAGHGPDKKPGFALFAGETKAARNVHIIYSGGDDMFLAGAWDDIIGVAVDIRHAFARYTNGKLTFSAGIGFFSPTCPIAQMARQTEELQDMAKAMPGKDSVALFGQMDEENGEANACYHWDDFENKVCGEKLGFLQNHFNIDGDLGSNKLPAGKSLLYRLMGLLRSADKNSIYLARFAYTLARMEPGRRASAGQKAHYDAVRQQLYTWYQENADRKQLITALELIIYHVRDKEEKGHERHRKRG